MRRQAVHEERVRSSVGHEGGVDLIGGEYRKPASGFVLLAHRRPHVGVNGIRSTNAGHWIGHEFEGPACPGDARHSRGDVIGQFEPRRRGDADVRAQHRGGLRERRRDVVAVADERNRPPAQRAPALREESGNPPAPGRDVPHWSSAFTTRSLGAAAANSRSLPCA